SDGARGRAAVRVPVDGDRDALHEHAGPGGGEPGRLLVPPARDALAVDRRGPPAPVRAHAAASADEAAAARSDGTVAAEGSRREESGAVARAEPAARPDPDGDR